VAREIAPAQAYGATGDDPGITRVNQGFILGSMSMAAYQFTA